ncbi:hypothetical protein ABZT03_44190, partial [Streptomyces sp. NPDC005574]|uniref:hypothetical protein n=1 Tax=Streptomyces sp. NPDC005574 TaxID=3156891 RepID=UPI0033A78D60
MKKYRSTAKLLAVIAVGAVIPGSAMLLAAPASATTVNFADRTSKREATLAVSFDGKDAVGYLCDGKKVGTWLRGALNSSGKFDLLGADGTHLSGAKGGKHVTGRIRLTDGRTWSFDLPEVKTATMYRASAGLYDKQLTAGWVVLPNGDQAGILERNGRDLPAPKLNTNATNITIDGIKMSIQKIFARNSRMHGGGGKTEAGTPAPGRTVLDGGKTEAGTPAPGRTVLDGGKTEAGTPAPGRTV